MNKKEIAEIKKTFQPEKSMLTRLCGCYVDGEKQIKCKTKEAFHSLSEEEAFKYFEIFKKSLSGTLGKNLLNLEFPMEQEAEGGAQEFLYRLRNSKLEDDELLDTFYEKVIQNFDYVSNYYIVLIHGVYDIPGKSKDGMEMFDASDEMYEYILCSICPVNLDKSGLTYDAVSGRMSERTRDWLVAQPANAFLFPAFNDRRSDIHSTLYYSKNAAQLAPEFIEGVLGAKEPMAAVEKKEAFQNIISTTLGEDCCFDDIRQIHDSLSEMIASHKDEPEPLELTKSEVRRILEDHGANQEQMEIFDETYDANVEKHVPILAANVAETRKFNIIAPDIEIKVNSDRTDLIQTRIIDGKQCLVIAVDDHIQVNGFDVRTLPKP